jgi:probable F420-dependent oxidoreductase
LDPSAPRSPGDLALVSDVVRGTNRITVATGIAPVDQVPSADITAAYTALADRFVPGLGGAHGAKPLATLNTYLDELDPVVPVSDRVLSALGPKMLELARDRAAGAYPYLVTPDYVASARSIIGPDKRLPVLLVVNPEADPATAREIARGGSLRFLSGMPGYANNFRRMGFTDTDISSSSRSVAYQTNGGPSCQRCSARRTRPRLRPRTSPRRGRRRRRCR